MIIVKLKGGVGNQMFQYALGRRLAHFHNVALKLDISNLNNIDPRPYGLQHFNIKAEIATQEEVLHMKNDANIEEKHFQFDEAVLNIAHGYLNGFWQSEKYFENIADIIRREFTIKDPLSVSNTSIMQEITNTNSISLHIRRGDYVTNPITNKFHGVLPLEYYYRSIDLISKNVEKPCFYIFSDDPEWAKAHLITGYPTCFVDINNGSDNDYQDLWLMSACKHNIIANSSFSWWGAWLNSNPQKIVITPQQWFQSLEFNTKDVIPLSWKKVSFANKKIEIKERAPKVTVLMPVYNAEEYLNEAIGSILRQTFTDFEFLIIDDGSTDHSVELIKSYDDPRIRLECNGENLGLIATLNKGLKMVRGEYIARMDNDDISRPQRLTRQVAFMDNNPQLGVCGAWSSNFGMVQRDCDYLPLDYETIKCQLFFNNCVGHPNVMMRSSFFKKYNLHYNPEHLYAEDYGLWVKCSFLFPIANIPEVLLDHRVRLTSMSAMYSKIQQDTVLSINKSNLERLGITNVDGESLEIHRKVLYDNIDYSNQGLIKQVGAWLKLIQDANQVKQCYPEPQFSNLLNGKLSEFYRRSKHQNLLSQQEASFNSEMMESGMRACNTYKPSISIDNIPLNILED